MEPASDTPTSDALNAAERPQNFPLAAALFLFAMVFFIVMDAMAKWLTNELNVIMIVWGRYMAQTLILIVVFGLSFPRRLKTGHLNLQVARSILLLGATFFFFAGLKFLPLSETTAIFFVAPLVVVALAGPMLGEKIGTLRWGAVGVGFCGMLLIQQPGTATFQWASLLPLAAAACYAFNQITTRKVTAGDSATTTLIFTALAGTVLISLVVPFFWETPTWKQATILLGMGAVGGIGHFCMILALARAPASALAPLDYSSLIWAALIGVLVFQESLPPMTLLGTAVIAGAGLFIMWREKKVKRLPNQ
ncbi:MAG: DMT family transporter [Rhodospirillaceae bacterium]|nr:DMT family transporter [Rhodospirillaceae bacterium]